MSKDRGVLVKKIMVNFMSIRLRTGSVLLVLLMVPSRGVVKCWILAVFGMGELLDYVDFGVF